MNSKLSDSETDFVMAHNNSRAHNLRSCPSCNHSLFGMPGGRDAICKCCGYKDPCCND